MTDPRISARGVFYAASNKNRREFPLCVIQFRCARTEKLFSRKQRSLGSVLLAGRGGGRAPTRSAPDDRRFRTGRRGVFVKQDCGRHEFQQSSESMNYI